MAEERLLEAIGRSCQGSQGSNLCLVVRRSSSHRLVFSSKLIVIVLGLAATFGARTRVIRRNLHIICEIFPAQSALGSVFLRGWPVR